MSGSSGPSGGPSPSSGPSGSSAKDKGKERGTNIDEEEENKRQLWLKKVGMDPHIIAFGQ